SARGVQGDRSRQGRYDDRGTLSRLSGVRRGLPAALAVLAAFAAYLVNAFLRFCSKPSNILCALRRRENWPCSQARQLAGVQTCFMVMRVAPPWNSSLKHVWAPRRWMIATRP